jgi:hypothetical protein
VAVSLTVLIDGAVTLNDRTPRAAAGPALLVRVTSDGVLGTMLVVTDTAGDQAPGNPRRSRVWAWIS